MGGLGSARVVWVDFAKGVAILAVVVHHAVYALAAVGVEAEKLLIADQQIATFRMPLFFLASGLFAHRALTGPWRPLLRRRVALYGWVYLVWSVIAGLAATAYVPPLRPPGPGGLGTFLQGLVVPATALWFIYALAVYAVLLRAARRVPPWIQLLGSALLSFVVGSSLVSVDQYVWRMMATCLVFFVAGVHYRWVVDRLVAITTWPLAIAAALAYAGATGVVGQLWEDKPPGVRLALSVLALVAGVCGSVVLGRVRALGFVSWLGQRTLQVYVAHSVLIYLAVTAMDRWDLLPSGLAGAVGVTAGLVVLGVLVSLGIGRAADRWGAGWLYAVPRRWAWAPVVEPAAVESGRAA